MLPARADVLTVCFVEKAERAVAQSQLGPTGNLVEFDFHMVQCRIRHEHRPAEFQQYRRLDHLHVAPEMADAIPTVTKPTATRPLLQNHVHGFAIWIRTALTKADKHGFKDITNISFEFNLLGEVQSHLFKFHEVSPYVIK